MQPRTPTPVGARRGPERRRSAAALAVVAVIASGCARARFVESRPPQVLIEVLPRSAEVLVDGQVLGRGSLTAPADRADTRGHLLAVRAPGFVAEEIAVPEGGLAGRCVAVALRPEGFGGARLDPEDAPALVAAAAFLLASAHPADAADYAVRARDAAPRLAMAHRILGDARQRMGDGRGAVAAWTEYLRLAPGAADGPEVARRLEATRAEPARERR